MSGFARFVLPFALAASPAAAQLSTVEGQAAPAAPTALATAVMPIAADDPMPKAPARVPASFATPVRDTLGRYSTPNRDLTAPEMLWHLRVALNVAALGCRDADEGTTVAAYNAVLAKGRAELAAAQTQMMIVYRQRHGKAAQARNDDAMTKLYNFFAQPTGHEEFCASAKAVLTEVGTIAPAALNDYAAAALPRLEAPFVLFFASWDAYRDSLSAWQTRHAAPVAAPAAVMVAAVPQPAGAPVATPAVILAAVAPAVTGSPAPTPAIVPAAPATPGAPAQVMVALTPEALAAIKAAGITGVTLASVPVAAAPAPTPVAATTAPPVAMPAVALVVKKP